MFAPQITQNQLLQHSLLSTLLPSAVLLPSAQGSGAEPTASDLNSLHQSSSCSGHRYRNLTHWVIACQGRACPTDTHTEDIAPPFSISLFHMPHQENNFFSFLLLPLILANYCKKQQTTPEAEHRLVHRFHIFFFNSLMSALNERIYNHTQVSQEIILAACLLNQQEKRINKMKSEKKSSI